jgi:hypothetical protein
MQIRLFWLATAVMLTIACSATAGAPVANGAPAADLPCALFPADNVWNTPINDLPLHPDSAAYVAAIGRDAPVHPDFGSGVWPPGSNSPIGIPYVNVPGDQPRVAVSFDYADESDPGPYPIPPDAPIEGGPDSRGDRHVLVVDRDNCVLYELYAAYLQPDGNVDGRIGRDFRPPQPCPAPRGLDLGRRGRIADIARPGALR